MSFYKFNSLKSGVSSTFLLNVYLIFIALIIGILIARVLGPDGRGQLALIFLYTQTFSWLFSLALPKANIYILNTSQSPDIVSKIFTHSILFSLFFGFIASLLLIFFLENLIDGVNDTVINSARVYIFCIPLIILGDNILNIFLGLRRYYLFNIKRALLPTLYVLSIIILYFFNELNLKNMLIIQSLNICLEVLISFLMLRYFYRLELSLDFSIIKKVFSYGLKSYPNQVAEIGGQGVDQILTAPFLSSHDFGIYTVARLFASQMNVITTSVQAVIFPEVASRKKSDAIDLLFKLLVFITPICLVVFIGMEVFGPFFITLLLGEDFFQSGNLMRFLLIAFLFTGLSQILQNGFYGLSKQFDAGIIEWTYLALCSILLTILIPNYGLYGVAYAFVAASVVRFFIYLIRLKYA